MYVMIIGSIFYLMEVLLVQLCGLGIFWIMQVVDWTAKFKTCFRNGKNYGGGTTAWIPYSDRCGCDANNDDIPDRIAYNSNNLPVSICKDVCTDSETKPCPYTGPQGTENKGVCKAGTQTCTNGQWGSCEGEVTPVDEVCGDNKDNNCDGNTDEGCVVCEDKDGDGYFAYDPIGCPQGNDCNDFEIEIHPGATEACNTIDDNCNGQKDETCMGRLMQQYSNRLFCQSRKREPLPRPDTIQYKHTWFYPFI